MATKVPTAPFFSRFTSPLDSQFDHLFRNPPKVKPEDRVEFVAKEGAPPKIYVWVGDILVPEIFLHVYRRTLYTKGPIFTPSTRFPEELKNDPDALFKFKVRTLGSILWAIHTTYYPSFGAPMIERRLQRLEEIIADGEAIQCNRHLMIDLRYLLDNVKLEWNRAAEEHREHEQPATHLTN
ncbi:hypothetical protein MKX01_013039 [Papaver californicum]|nr:hypothetical protein MKX01_013039 [Papaver californicum]